MLEYKYTCIRHLPFIPKDWQEIWMKTSEKLNRDYFIVAMNPVLT